MENRKSLVIAVATLLLLAACKEDQQPAAMPLPEVGVVSLTPATVRLQTELAGRTTAYLTSEVRPQVDGLVEARLFTEGSYVEAGQALYRIDDASYQAAFQQAKAQLAIAQAELTAAQQKAKRYGDLVKINGVSKQDRDDAEAAYQEAVATIALDQASLDSAGINLDRTVIKAPISGWIGRSSITQGALVTASQSTALAKIQKLDPIYVDITQSAVDLIALKRQLASGGAEPSDAVVSLVLEDGTLYPLEGVLQFAEVDVNEDTGMVTLRAQFPNPDNLLLPGMYVRAILTQAVRHDAILAPQQAITRDAKGQAIAWVVGADGKIEQRTLLVGQTVGDQWLVTSGLSAGDRLVVDGLQKARVGASVTVVELPAAGTDAATQPSPSQQTSP